MAAKQLRMRLFIQPIEWIDAQMFMADRQGQVPDLRSAIDFLCTPGVGKEPEDLVSRYREVSADAKRICFAPGETEILHSIFWPLRHARAAYVLGNYLATIALCGAVCEVLTLLLFEMRPVVLGKTRMSRSREKRVFGKRVDDLSQERRINILRGLGKITGEMANDFDEVRKMRNEHLHGYFSTHETAQQDAVTVYRTTASLVADTLGCGLAPNAATFSPELIDLLHKKAIVTEVEMEETEESQTDDTGA